MPKKKKGKERSQPFELLEAEDLAVIRAPEQISKGSGSSRV
jgi:hypothetical protein